jgi:hypothetical protein
MRTTHLLQICSSIGLFVSLSFSPSTYADGLSDLQQALKRLKQTSPFSAQINASLKRSNGEEKDKANEEGRTQFTLEQNQSGLQITYPTELLGTIDKETQLKKQDPQALTPTTDAMNRFKYAEFSILFNPVRDIEDDLQKATLIKEESTSYQNQPARLLHLSIPLDKLNEDEKKNLKKYQTDLQIWINEQGIPLASRSTGKGSGRFALVIGFEFNFDVEKAYITSGDRLLVSKLTSTSGSSGAGMNENETITANLTLIN